MQLAYAELNLAIRKIRLIPVLIARLGHPVDASASALVAQSGLRGMIRLQVLMITIPHISL
jgi:hypothetical protein